MAKRTVNVLFRAHATWLLPLRERTLALIPIWDYYHCVGNPKWGCFSSGAAQYRARGAGPGADGSNTLAPAIWRCGRGRDAPMDVARSARAGQMVTSQRAAGVTWGRGPLLQ